MTVNEVQDSIIEEFSVFDDWMDKYNLLIDMGKDLPAIDPKYKMKEFLIEGCQSKVWLHPEYNGEKIKFTADSDAIITKGIVGLLIKVLSGRTPEEIIGADLYLSTGLGSDRICSLQGRMSAGKIRNDINACIQSTKIIRF
jgi:cysteine desulfuration protein SufE